MAMTKSEQSELKALRQELAEAKALRFLGIPEPTRMPLPENGYESGWDFNVYSMDVTKAWTDRHFHSRSGHRSDNATVSVGRHFARSQSGLPLYATKLDALIAMRLAKERDCAKQLADADQRIEAERATANTGNTP